MNLRESILRGLFETITVYINKYPHKRGHAVIIVYYYNGRQITQRYRNLKQAQESLEMLEESDLYRLKYYSCLLTHETKVYEI